MIAKTIAKDKLEQARVLHKLLGTLKKKGIDPDQVFFGEQDPEALSADIIDQPFTTQKPRK